MTIILYIKAAAEVCIIIQSVVLMNGYKYYYSIELINKWILVLLL